MSGNPLLGPELLDAADLLDKVALELEACCPICSVAEEPEEHGICSVMTPQHADACRTGALLLRRTAEVVLSRAAATRA